MFTTPTETPAVLTSLRSKYKTLIVSFIPSNCTPKLQPLDVYLMAFFKKQVEAAAVSWVSKQVREVQTHTHITHTNSQVSKQLESRTHPADVALDTSKKNLVLPFCSWVNQSLAALESRSALVGSAWEKSGLQVMSVVRQHKN